MNDVILGDCLEEMKNIPDNSIDMILTDLPYGVTARNKWDIIIPFDKLWEQWNRIKKATTPIILTSIQPFTVEVVKSNIRNFKYEWIWEKGGGSGYLNAKKQPLRNHESISVFYDKQCVYNPQLVQGNPYKKIQVNSKPCMNYGNHKVIDTINKSGLRYPKTVISIPNSNHNSKHPTQKPVALFEYLIKTYTNEGDTVLDCCAGSGTTGVACKNLNRNYILIEKEQKYYDIIKERLK
jgi:site-specific DNA-methyltransferase (adenine-specific)